MNNTFKELKFKFKVKFQNASKLTSLKKETAMIILLYLQNKISSKLNIYSEIFQIN